MVSRQRLWQRKQIEEGNCSQCGKPRGSNHHYCDDCARTYQKRSGFIPWKSGGRGRVPFGRESENDLHRSKLADRAEMLYWEKDMVLKDVAKVLGLTVNTLLKIMRDYGVPRRKRGPQKRKENG